MRLLDVLGFDKCLSILTKQKEKENKDKDHLSRRKTGNNRDLTYRLGINDSDCDTENKRNPLADVYREQWQALALEKSREVTQTGRESDKDDDEIYKRASAPLLHRSAISRKRDYLKESRDEDYVLSESNSSSELDNNTTDRGSTSIIKL